ncbi:hypothetical protein [Hydrogenophaga sp.]
MPLLCDFQDGAFYLGVSHSGERKSYQHIKHDRRRKRWLGWA